MKTFSFGDQLFESIFLVLAQNKDEEVLESAQSYVFACFNQLHFP